ncbi:MAG: hypothetical protein Q9P90_17300 [candidate division KSB1 bacterium]|nr:hypothetical protein [candidate division KSB1 bacterium]
MTVGAFGEVDRTHTAGTEHAYKTVISDAGAGRQGGVRQCHGVDGMTAQQAVGVAIGFEKGNHFIEQGRVAVAGLAQKGLPLGLGFLQGGFEQGLDAMPAGLWHVGSFM